MLNKETKQELENIMYDVFADESESAYAVLEAFEAINATPEQIRGYLRREQDNYTDIAQECEKEDNPEDAIYYHNKANQIAKLIAKLK